MDNKIIRYMQTKTPGARIFKTGIGVSISLFICQALQIPSPILAGIAAITNMQPGTAETIKNAKDQAKAHILAILIALFFGYFFGANPLVMGLVTMLIITICLQLKLDNAIQTTIIAAIFILYSPEQHYLLSAAYRTAAIFIGIAVAFLVNITILPPENEKRLLEEAEILHTMIRSFFTQALQRYGRKTMLLPEELEATRTEIEEHFEKIKKLNAAFQSELEIEDERRQKKQKLFNAFITYHKVLFYHINDIHFLAEHRMQRENEAGNHMEDESFSGMEAYIWELYDKFQQVHDQFLLSLQGGKVDYPEEENIWQVFTGQLLESCDGSGEKPCMVTTVNEISIIVYKIRWAISEIKKIGNTNM